MVGGLSSVIFHRKPRAPSHAGYILGGRGINVWRPVGDGFGADALHINTVTAAISSPFTRKTPNSPMQTLIFYANK